MRNVFLFFSVSYVVIGMAACHSKNAPDTAATPPDDVRTPVTITTITYQPLSEYVDLNATSAFLQSSFIKSRANGYIKSVNVRFGQYVNDGQLVFTMKTKESQALGNTINVLDSSFNFSGVINIYSSTHGFISQLNHQEGDYVQDGEQLAVISDSKSFVFILNLPYELRPYVLNKKTVELLLPDGKSMKGSPL